MADEGSEPDDDGSPGRMGGGMRRRRYEGLLDHHRGPEVDRLFLISLKHKFVFCPVPKVANSSIKTFLFEAELMDSGIAPGQYDFSARRMHELLNSPFIRPFQLPRGLLQKVLFGPDYRRIVFVRHPVDRIVSCFLDRVQEETSIPSRMIKEALGLDTIGGVSFADFVDFVGGQSVREMDQHWRPIYYEAMFDQVAYDDVLRFEEIATALPALLRSLYPRLAGRVDLTRNLSPSITGARGKAAELVTPEIRQKIETIYEKDFTTFGY